MEEKKIDSLFFKKYEKILSENDFLFINRVFSSGIKSYSERLKAIGFENKAKVLDIGCGFGQWAIALSGLNADVYASDVSSLRLMVLKDICTHLNISNIHISHDSLENTRFKKSEFDAVFCYGAVFIANPLNALKEFFRILKPGGQLYVNANGLGWSLNLWLAVSKSAKGYDPRLNVAKAFQNTVNVMNGLPKQEGQVIIEKEEMISMLKKVGFKKMLLDGEGKINLSKDKKLKPVSFFKEEYYGFTGVYEILATK